VLLANPANLVSIADCPVGPRVMVSTCRRSVIHYLKILLGGNRLRKVIWSLLVPPTIGLVFLIVGYNNAPDLVKGNWFPGVLTSAGVVFISISISELFLTYGRKWIKEKDQRSFEQLFGTCDTEPGHIVLQDDRMDRLLEKLFKDSEGERSGPAQSGANRLLKARRWINAHDADGSREIRDCFRKLRFVPPELVIVGREGSYDHKNAPFVICMGMGFTTESLNIVKNACAGWMLIDTATEMGDAVALHKRLCPYSHPDFEKFVASTDGYIRLFPLGWKINNYIAVPDRLQEGSPGRLEGIPSRDYAIILRHTEEQPSSARISFVLAGFTAHGTAAAGKYLADNWPSLWTKYVKNRVTGGDGDFCEIIVGNSGESHWKSVRDFHLTPKSLAGWDEKKEWAWTKRYLARYPQRPAVD
jgi:hypothetical protein